MAKTITELEVDKTEKPLSKTALRKIEVADRKTASQAKKEARIAEKAKAWADRKAQIDAMTIAPGDVFHTSYGLPGAPRRGGAMRRVIGIVRGIVVYSDGGDKTHAVHMDEFKTLCAAKLHDTETSV